MPILNVNPPKEVGIEENLAVQYFHVDKTIDKLVGRRVTTAPNLLRVIEFVDASMTSSGPTGIGLVDFVSLGSVRYAPGVI